MEPTQGNISAWETAHRAPEEEGDAGLPDAVREWLPALEGRHVLQVGGGPVAAAELGRRGGVVTVVADGDAVAAGTRLGSTAAWIVADVHSLPVELRRQRFHLAVADADAVRDPASWASGIEAALRPGGYLLAYGAHPAARCVDGIGHWHRDYFRTEEPTLGELVTAVVRSGLVLRRLGEVEAQRPHRRPTPYPATFALVAARPAADTG